MKSEIGNEFASSPTFDLSEIRSSKDPQELQSISACRSAEYPSPYNRFWDMCIPCFRSSAKDSNSVSPNPRRVMGPVSSLSPRGIPFTWLGKLCFCTIRAILASMRYIRGPSTLYCWRSKITYWLSVLYVRIPNDFSRFSRAEELLRILF